jgi:WD40 repeat protein
VVGCTLDASGCYLRQWYQRQMCQHYSALGGSASKYLRCVQLNSSACHELCSVLFSQVHYTGLTVYVVACWTSLKVVTEVRCSKSGITALAYSQDGTLLAAACADGDVHILRVENKVRRHVTHYTLVLLASSDVIRCISVYLLWCTSETTLHDHRRHLTSACDVLIGYIAAAASLLLFLCDGIGIQAVRYSADSCCHCWQIRGRYITRLDS